MKHTLVLFLYLQLVNGRQDQNCNFQLENKIVNFEYEAQPGYHMGLYEKKNRGGMELLLSLIWAGESLNYRKAMRPGALWIAEKCKDQLCFSRMKYDERELGDYYKSIKDEKNYIYMTRFEGLTVRHVSGHDIEKWKTTKPDDGDSFFPGFDVMCSTCEPYVGRLKHCAVLTRKNKIERWNSDKVGKMMGTSSGWVQFEDTKIDIRDTKFDWTIQKYDKAQIPLWYLGPNSGFQLYLSPCLVISIILNSLNI